MTKFESVFEDFQNAVTRLEEVLGEKKTDKEELAEKVYVQLPKALEKFRELVRKIEKNI